MYLFTYAYSDEDTNELYAEYHLSRQVSYEDILYDGNNENTSQGTQNLQERNKVLRLAPGDA